MSSLSPDLTSKIYPDPDSITINSNINETSIIDQFDRLPDSLLLLIFNKIGEVKALGRFSFVSRRFQTLVSQVENVVVRVDCVISDDDMASSSSSSSSSSSCKSRGPIFSFFRLFIGGIFKPLRAFGQLLGPTRASSVLGSSSSSPSSSSSSSWLSPSLTVGRENEEFDQNGVTHHSPTQVLKNFNEIRFLKIELPGGELDIDDGVLLKWRAEFGSSLDNCVILGASSVIKSESDKHSIDQNSPDGGFCTGDGNGTIPESFYTNGGLKLRVVWTISSLIAASARHYLLQPIISEHKSLSEVVLTDSDGQGVLCMNKDQLEELRFKPLSASLASKRTLVPALKMRLWHAPYLELPDGVVLKGATLVAIRPREKVGTGKEVLDVSSWVSAAFEEPYRTAAKMLVKRRTYCLEMNSF